MKNSTSTTIRFIVVFIWSWFMGITAVSIGFGTIFPIMNRVAKPFVCPGGQMELNSQNYQVSPVEHGTSLTWFCVDNYAETKTELNPFIINFYAGSFYGLLIGAAGLSGYYLYKRWDPAKETEQTKKRIARIQSISVIVIIVGVTLFSLMPLIRMLTYTPDPTPIPDASATSIAITYDELTSKTISDFNSSEKPLAAWNDIPIMPNASAGQ